MRRYHDMMRFLVVRQHVDVFGHVICLPPQSP